MIRDAPDASPFVPRSRNLARLARAARACRGCPLYRQATQTVFGEGPARAAILLVGEQPGDREDREGRPFVGPAGSELASALDAAGLSRENVYVTNAVKHFKFEERGKRRIHKKPRVSEVVACHPWLAAEIEAVSPKVVVALGATAADALGRMPPPSAAVLRSLHPAAILRAPDPESRRRLRANLKRDLRKAKRLAAAEKG
ncbi:MAG TPA: UdgX family uracil-DNA binding protein [Thermoanaerobaculia bacterium]